MGSETTAVNLLKAEIPLEEEHNFALSHQVDSGKTMGLVLVDIVNGFCTVGAGNLVINLPPLSLLFSYVEFFLFGRYLRLISFYPA